MKTDFKSENEIFDTKEVIILATSESILWGIQILMLVFGYNLLITLIQMKREEPVIEENNPFRDAVVRQIKRRL